MDQLATFRELLAQTEHVIDQLGKCVPKNDWVRWRVKQNQRRLAALREEVERLARETQEALASVAQDRKKAG